MMRRELYCGFCGKAQDEVKKLIAGPCIHICNECIDTAHQLVHAPEPELPVKPPKPAKKVLSFADEARKRGRR